jgi:hypothetical protein
MPSWFFRVMVNGGVLRHPEKYANESLLMAEGVLTQKSSHSDHLSESCAKSASLFRHAAT